MFFCCGVWAFLQVADDGDSQPIGLVVCLFEHFHQFVHDRPIFPTSEIGNDHVSHFGPVQQLANRFYDSLFRNKVDFGAMKAKRGNCRKSINIIDLLVSDESRFDEVNAGLFLEV